MFLHRNPCKKTLKQLLLLLGTPKEFNRENGTKNGPLEKKAHMIAFITETCIRFKLGA